MKVGLAMLLAVVALTGWAEADDDSASLEERVKTLEASLAAVQKGSAGTELRVRSLVVVDDMGKPRITLGRRGGVHGLEVRDSQGRTRMTLHVTNGDGDPSVTLLSSQGDGRLTMRLNEGSPRLWLGSPKSSVIVKAPVDGAAGIGMWGGPGAHGQQSHAGFWVWDDGTIAWGGGQRSAGRTGFILKQSRDGEAEFKVRDHKEVLLWEMPTRPPAAKER